MVITVIGIFTICADFFLHFITRPFFYLILILKLEGKFYHLDDFEEKFRKNCEKIMKLENNSKQN